MEIYYQNNKFIKIDDKWTMITYCDDNIIEWPIYIFSNYEILVENLKKLELRKLKLDKLNNLC